MTGEKGSKLKVCYLISDIDRAIAFEWIANAMKDRFRLSFILLNRGDSELEHFLRQHNHSVYRVQLYGGLVDVFVILSVIKLFRKIRPGVIHCHLFQASLFGLVAGWMAGIEKRIFTRHHSTYNHEYNKKGIWVDRLINSLATDIVAISENVKTVLVEQEKVGFQKIHLIHHGFDLQSFGEVDPLRIEILRKKYGIQGKPVIGVIARWIEWKGIQYIIPAFKQLRNDYPDAHLLLANANGPFKEHLEKLLDELPENSFSIIRFEEDLFALYQLFDIYVHTPINEKIEAFGQTYVEALAAGIPSVFTASGVASEFIDHEKNALVVPYKNSEAIYKAMKSLLEDERQRKALIEVGRKSVQKFALTKMIDQLSDLYS